MAPTLSTRKQYEKRIADEFVRLDGRGWQIVEDDRETPDFILGRDGEVGGLELTSYREQGPHNEAHERDQTLKTFIHDAWLVDNSVNEFSLHLFYRSDIDRGFYLVKKRSLSKVVGELRGLVHSIDDPVPNDRTRFTFVTGTAAILAKRRGDAILPAEVYPTLSAHFQKVIVTYHPGFRGGHLRTSVSGRHTNADADEIERVLGGKLSKLPEYRANLPDGAPMILLIHSDGWPPSARISNDMIMQRALGAAKLTAVTGDAHRFDEVWWLDNADISLDCRLYRVA